jgi:Fe-S-cluster containining protein
MHDRERLQRVATALAEAVSAREQGKQVKLPVIQRADAAALTNFMHAQLDDAIARRDAEIGARMACGKGCNQCCASPVLITEGEAIAVAEHLREHADVRARFEAAYPTWRDKVGDLVDHAADQRDAEQTRAWALRVQERHAMCAFNHEGACSIYPVRPALCRKAHALDTNQYCASDGGKVQYYQHPETENVYEGQRSMKFALHMTMRPNGRLDLLCSAVHRLLGGTAAGRNDPCPCGSGKKYKKCCGA